MCFFLYEFSISTSNTTLSLSLTITSKGVYLPDGDHMSQHVTEPLGIQKVQVLQGGILIVQHHT